MDKSFKRVRDTQELKEREAIGLWHALALSRKIGESRERITIETILSLHKVLLGNVMPEAAGRFRVQGEDVKKLECVEPPPGLVAQDRIYEFWREFDRRISLISVIRPEQDRPYEEWLNELFDLATWAQHQLVSIHPFCDGNGRMARLFANIILLRFGLPISRVKFEGENKSEYLKALCQADLHADYEPLKNILVEGAMETLLKEEKRRRDAVQF